MTSIETTTIRTPISMHNCVHQVKDLRWPAETSAMRFYVGVEMRLTAREMESQPHVSSLRHGLRKTPRVDPLALRSQRALARRCLQPPLDTNRPARQAPHDTSSRASSLLKPRVRHRALISPSPPWRQNSAPMRRC